MDTEKKSLNFFFATKYVIPNSLKFSHWLSEIMGERLEIGWVKTTHMDHQIASCTAPKTSNFEA